MCLSVNIHKTTRTEAIQCRLGCIFFIIQATHLYVVMIVKYYIDYFLSEHRFFHNNFVFLQTNLKRTVQEKTLALLRVI